MQAADIKEDCNAFTVCVAIGMFVLGLCLITLLSFFPGTGLLDMWIPLVSYEMQKFLPVEVGQ